MSVRYENVKASLKAELGDKYPKSINNLTDKFICEVLAPELELDDIIAIDAKRDELKTNPKSSNWFPAFRSWVGKTYFADEFGKKTSAKVSEDKVGNSLKALIAQRKANK